MTPLNDRRSFLFSAMLWMLSALLLPAIAYGAEKKAPARPASPVRVAQVMEDEVAEQIMLIGTVEPVATSEVASETSGIVEVFPIREGQFVEKGSTLVMLRTAGLRLQRKALVAQREAIRANLKRAEKELARTSKLKDANSIAQRSYDDAKYGYEALEQELNRSQAQIEQIDDDIRQAVVTAPFSGYVAVEHTQVGEWVPTGGPVATLLDLERVRITVDVPERYAVHLKTGKAAFVSIDSLNMTRVPATVTAILPSGDPTARTFPVRVEIDNDKHRLLPGMEARVAFDLATRRRALLVPKDAIVNAGNNRMVFMVAGGKALPVMVKILGYYDGNVAVEAKLTPGTPVVIRGNERLRPGQPVRVE